MVIDPKRWLLMVALLALSSCEDVPAGRPAARSPGAGLPATPAARASLAPSPAQATSPDTGIPSPASSPAAAGAVATACVAVQPAGCAPANAPRASAATGASASVGAGPSQVAGIPTPRPGMLYHGVYPGGPSNEEDDVTADGVAAYEAAAGKSVAWVYFSNNWGKSRQFPATTAAWIRARGSIPFIRLMLRTSTAQNQAEPTFTLERIRQGDFDADLRAWADAARDFKTPLLVEYGTEVNGRWFAWNGTWNGAGGSSLGAQGPDGPARFREAYRHIVQTARAEGATNIQWVFHANYADDPTDGWNRLESYYPGSAWVDWIGVSVYGAQKPDDTDTPSFRELMDAVYPRLTTLDGQKPIALCEFGVTNHNPRVDQAAWAGAALTDLDALRWPRLVGYAWWNETWPNDDNPAHNSVMRLQDNPALATAFQAGVGAAPHVLGRIDLAP